LSLGHEDSNFCTKRDMIDSGVLVFCILVTADLHISAVNCCDSEMLICIFISYLVNTFFKLITLLFRL